MNLTDELRNLSELHQRGQLTDAEFTNAKAQLLAQEGRPPPAPESFAPTSAAPAAVRIKEKTYRSSRWSSGNLFFPDRLTIANDGIVFRKGALFGSNEEHISYRAIASFRIKNGIFLSNVNVETSGGSQPIFINGLWKSAAREIQEVIRLRQGNAA
ncbi:MAG: hypothetical protein JWM88_663 [Verrucomicrobia bacterium]|nr:hypothetical protein [Verrucomicrobiota bacterium]